MSVYVDAQGWVGAQTPNRRLTVDEGHRRGYDTSPHSPVVSDENDSGTPGPDEVSPDTGTLVEDLLGHEAPFRLSRPVWESVLTSRVPRQMSLSSKTLNDL